MSADRPVRVRFAPSPTGRLHLGGARTALFNWAFARHHGGVLVLRVEDTDLGRNSEESYRSILDSLRWLGLDWDEGPECGGGFGPYLQSERLAGYREAAARGLEEGWLYRCFCPPERVAARKEEQRAAKQPIGYDRCCRAMPPEEAERRAAAGESSVLRFAMPEDEDVEIEDLIRGSVRFRAAELEDWVAVRSNGMPTYNFVCALDDAAMEISHVIRGEEHLVNTPKQILVARRLGLSAPRYAHVPLILGADGRKLSKRVGDTALEDYRAKGYPAAAIFHFLGLLGFAIDDHTDRFTPEEFVAAFDLSRVSRSGAVFDLDRLHWLCGELLREEPPAVLQAHVRPWLEDAGLVASDPDPEWYALLVESFRERCTLYADFATQAAFLGDPAPEPDAKAAKALTPPAASELLHAFASALEASEDWPPADFGTWVRAFAAERGVGLGKLLKPARAALTGTLGGPPVDAILALLGRERTLARLRAY